MKEEKKRIEREELAEKLGWNDPKCPPGHMLMPPEQLKKNLTNFHNRKFSQLLCIMKIFTFTSFFIFFLRIPNIDQRIEYNADYQGFFSNKKQKNRNRERIESAGRQNNLV